MKLEVHTFDPELLILLMGKDPVAEGDELRLSENASLRYERTFSRKVKHFPIILHFSVGVSTAEGADQVVNWLFERAGKRNLEKIVVEYQDTRMDPGQLRDLLSPQR